MVRQREASPGEPGLLGDIGVGQPQETSAKRSSVRGENEEVASHGGPDNRILECRRFLTWPRCSTNG